jgi:hypothetical protein
VCNLIDLIPLVQVVIGLEVAYLQLDQFSITEKIGKKLMDVINRMLDSRKNSYTPENIKEKQEGIISKLHDICEKKLVWKSLIFRQKWGRTMDRNIILFFLISSTLLLLALIGLDIKSFESKYNSHCMYLFYPLYIFEIIGFVLPLIFISIGNRLINNINNALSDYESGILYMTPQTVQSEDLLNSLLDPNKSTRVVSKMADDIIGDLRK